MADQLAQARTALAEGRAQEVVDDIEAWLDVLVLLLSAAQATRGSAYDKLHRGRDRDLAFRYAHKFFEMTKAQPGPDEVLAIVPALDARGKRDLAIGALRAVAASYPDNASVAQLLASELEETRDPGAASAYADLARRLGPDDVAEQVGYLKKAARLDSGNPGFHASLGEALLRSGDVSGAVTELRAAIADLALDHDAHLWLAKAVRASGDQREALNIVNPIVAMNPDRIAARLVRADIYTDLGELEAAMADVDHVIELDPGSVTAQRTRAQLLARLGRDQEAISALTAVLAAVPDDRQALMALGRTQYALGELDESVRDFSETARMAAAAGDAPLTAAALAWQGEALRLLGRYSEALKVLDDAEAAGPASAFTLGTKGQVLAMLGRHDEAVEALTAASGMDSSVTWIHTTLADVYRLERRWDQALAEVTLASTGGETALTHFLRGQVLAGMGQVTAGVDELRAAWTMQPSPEIAEELATVLASLGTRWALEESLAVMEETLSARPAGRSLLARRAETLWMLGRPNDALAAIDVILHDGVDAKMAALKALVLADLGRGPEALELAKAARSEDPENIFARCAEIEARMASNEYEDALEAADSFLADMPGQPFGVSLKGAILCNIYSFREALETLTPILEDNPDQPFTNALVGYALRRQEPPDLQRAADYFRRAVDEDPDETWYQIELADTLDLLGREPEARQIRRQVLDRTPTGSRATSRSLGYAGWAALFIDHTEDAVTLIGEGVQLDPRDFPLRFAFAFALLHAGQDELAIDEYQAVVVASGKMKSRRYREAIIREALSDLGWARRRGRLEAVQVSAAAVESLLSAVLTAKD